MKGNENIKHPIGIDPQEITGVRPPGPPLKVRRLIVGASRRAW